MTAARLCLLLFILAAPLAVPAQSADAGWRSVVDSPAPDGAPVTIAEIISGDGHSVRIYRDEGDVVRGIFTLGNERDRFEDGNCPTVRIDNLPPHALVDPGGACDVGDGAVRFILGSVENQRVQSTVLWQLMNGSGFRVWYHLEGLGYREARFSLRRSMNALTSVLGPYVEVAP